MEYIYLDNNSYTPLDNDVSVKLTRLIQTNYFANPDSTHSAGRKMRSEIENVRSSIARLFGVANMKQVIFFSSVTEALNTLIRSVIVKMEKQKYVISFSADHTSIRATLSYWCEHYGISLHVISVNNEYSVNFTEVRALIHNAGLCVVGTVNGETGDVFPLEPLCALCESNRVPLILDDAAGFGRKRLVFDKSIYAVCFSGAKINAPSGIGVAVLGQPSGVVPLIYGGGQEFNIRSGTPNFLAIVGLGVVINKMLNGYTDIIEHLAKLRDVFEAALLSMPYDIYINHGTGGRISNVSNVSFLNIEADTMSALLDAQGVCVSQGSACGYISRNADLALARLGYDDQRVRTSIRFSFGKQNTLNEVYDTINILRDILVKHL